MASSLFSRDKKDNSNPNNLGDLQSKVIEMVKDKDPKDVFFEECKKRNVNPNFVLRLAKMFGAK